MKYFNRHTEMSPQTLKTIMEAINGVMLSGAPDSFNLVNMLYGLFDGFDYTAEILSDPLMKSLQKSHIEIYNKISGVCEEIQGYPKFEKDVTSH